MSRVEAEKEYWNEAALDPDVDVKYISDIDTGECMNALVTAEYTLPSEPKICEIGCGVGRLTTEFAKQLPHSSILGVDISANMLKVAKLRRSHTNILYAQTDGRNIPGSDYDFIYSMLVFQHLPIDAVEDYLSCAAEALKPGGYLRFQFIEGNENEPFSYHHSYQRIQECLTDNRMKVISYKTGLVHPQWSWITAQKKAKK